MFRASVYSIYSMELQWYYDLFNVCTYFCKLYVTLIFFNFVLCLNKNTTTFTFVVVPRKVPWAISFCKDHNTILILARTKGTFEVHGSKVSFFLDFSITVKKLIAQYEDIKRWLCILQIQYAMLYLAKLQREMLFFDTPKAAASWLDKNIWLLPEITAIPFFLAPCGLCFCIFVWLICFFLLDCSYNTV